MVHELKTWPKFFSAIVHGEKTFEFRKNDRGFSVGDALILREWDGTYTGREVTVDVGYILALPGSDMVIMSIFPRDTEVR